MIEGDLDEDTELIVRLKDLELRRYIGLSKRPLEWMALLVLFILAEVDRLLLDAEVTENGDSDEDEDTRSFAIELAF